MPVCCLRLKECLFRFQVFRANEDVKSVGWWRQQKFLLSYILIPASHHLQFILIWKFTIDRDQNNVLFSYLEKNKEIIRKQLTGTNTNLLPSGWFLSVGNWVCGNHETQNCMRSNQNPVLWAVWPLLWQGTL